MYTKSSTVQMISKRNSSPQQTRLRLDTKVQTPEEILKTIGSVEFRRYAKKIYGINLGKITNKQIIKQISTKQKVQQLKNKSRDTQNYKPVVVKQRVSVSGMNIKTIYLDSNHTMLSDYYFEDFEDMLKRFQKYENSRTIVHIYIRNSENQQLAYTPDKLLKFINGYNFADDFEILRVEVKSVPEKGSCDTRQHDITFVSYTPDNKSIKLKCKTIKSKENNCLINAFISIAKTKINANTVRLQLNLAKNQPIAVEHCSQLEKIFNVSYSAYKIQENTLQTIIQSDIKLDKHLDLLLSDGHYFIIDDLPADLLSFQLQIQTTENVMQQSASQLILTENKDLPIIHSESITYKQILTNPSIAEIQDLIDIQDCHIFIQGGAGTGKSYTLKKLKNIQYSASTGCASVLINGNTIHSLVKKNFKDCLSIIAIDEISMIGATFFDELMIKNEHFGKRFILCGDVLQLPPVKDQFFFQSTEYYRFARNCVLVQLNDVKRQSNIDEYTFLNNLRIGQVDFKYLNKLYKNIVKNPQIIIAGSNQFVNEYNTDVIKNLNQTIITFKPVAKSINEKELPLTNDQIKKALKDHSEVKLCNKSRIMLTVNLDVEKGLVNGSLGYILSIDKRSVNVQFDNGITQKIAYHFETENQIQIGYMPLIISYCITVHKSQGQSFESAMIYTDDFFEKGQAYVALSRVRSLKNLQLIGTPTEFITKAFQPNQMAYQFITTGRVFPADQLLLISDLRKQIKNVAVKDWKEPQTIWNHIYIDFETYLIASKQRPYYNKILHINGDKIQHSEQLFDQLWDGGNRCDVGQKTWEYIKNVMIEHGNDLKQLKHKKSDKAIIKKVTNLTPTLIAFNGSGFDFNFIMKKFLADRECGSRFKLNTIYKGSNLIFLNVYDRLCGEVVMRSHDMCQIVGCALKDALTNFCSTDEQAQSIAKKIEFKDEIIYVMNNYHFNPNILKPNHKSNITQRLYKENGIFEKDLNKTVCLYDELIKYADNDTNCLPILYKCVDQLTNEYLNSNVTSFLTAGSMAHYGFMSNLPKECITKQTYNSQRNYKNKDKKVINTELYLLEHKQQQFVFKSIKGGRVCPRIHKITPDQKILLNYLDISGMYASIMKNELLPFGTAIFANNTLLKQIEKTVQHIARDSQWRNIFNSLTKKFGMFLAEVDFQENENNLEPIIQYKQSDRSIYTLERRTDIISSVDISLIIASGGQIHSIKQVMVWDKYSQIMRPWTEKTLQIKNEGELTNNPAKKSFGKLMANSAYGQTLKQDKNEKISFLSSWEEADQFVTEFKITNMFDCGAYDVYQGKKKLDQELFITSRCQQIGSFVLAYTRAMIYEICEIAMPNRYNEKGINEQPLYGDTDSLTFRKWQTDLLIKAGWIAKENGKLTDELGEDSNWFLPPRLIDITRQVPNNKSLKQILAQEQEQLWLQATEEEKRDPNNFFMYYFDDAIFAAPKSYAVLYKNYDGSKSYEKIKFKGIPKYALIGDVTYNMDIVKFAYRNPGKVTAILQSKPQLIKRFTQKEGKDTFLDIVDSNLRGDKPMSRKLFKTQWIGRHHIDDNITVPFGWKAMPKI